MFYDVLCLKSILGVFLSERTSGVSPVIFLLFGIWHLLFAAIYIKKQQVQISLQQITIEAEVVCGASEEEETQVNF